MTNKTKIIATIGPASNNKTILKRMISAGMNVARLNFSHGTYEQHFEVIQTIRKLSEETHKPIGILLDLQGPKIRTGTLKNGVAVLLKNRSAFKITSRKVVGTDSIVSTTYTNLPGDVKKGDTILIDDGLVELKVVSKSADTVTTTVIVGGMLKEHKGINLPGVNISAPSLTTKDIKDLKYGIKVGVDYFALSFVRTAADLRHIKAIIKNQKSEIPVIAKIEKPEAIHESV